MKTKRLGEVLIEEDMITPEQLQLALDKQKQSGGTLGRVLVELEFLTEDTLYHFLAIQHEMEYVDLENFKPVAELAKILSSDKAVKMRLVPISRDQALITIATSNPENPALLHLEYELVVEPGTRFKIVLAKDSQIEEAIKKLWSQDISAQPMLTGKEVKGATLEDTLKDIEEMDENAEAGDVEVMEIKKPGADDDDDNFSLGGDEAPVIRLCNFIIDDAISKGASDIHINPYEKKIELRYRIDGTLFNFAAPPLQFKKAICSRFKIMAKLDPMERRRAQDGRIKYKFRGRTVELRVAILPSIWGENIVMRILDQTRLPLDLSEQNFLPEQLKAFKQAYTQPYGMIIVTGSTGSGKTTTLYSILNDINDPEANIMTAEDPVEYRLPHIIQSQVNPKAGNTFPAILRSFLRQDPDVIMVGEIRDAETGTIAIKASLTGHLVISTTHTNDAPSTISRLVDMGIDPMYVGTSLLVICSQTLIRKICEKCKEPWTPDPVLLARAGLTMEKVEGYTMMKGKGCDQCHNSGYKGRMAVHEVLPINHVVRETIFKRANILQLKQVAKETGMLSMREVALVNFSRGETSLEEVLAKTMDTTV
jgi:type IV pilus assembly protein PilB